MSQPINAYLDVITVISNPIRWASRTRLAREAIAGWLLDPHVRITLVEAAYGERPHDLADLASERVRHVAVRANSQAWNKESLLNIGINRLPSDAKYVGTFDADVHFRRKHWAQETMHTLQVHHVVQPWDAAYDLGPNDEHMQVHRSFGSLFHTDRPVVDRSHGKHKWWDFHGGPYHYAHPGFAWAWTMDILDRLGGLLEIGLMGSGDHHMALGLVGLAERSMPGGVTASYRDAIMTWQGRALHHVNKRVGFVHGTIEHKFHARKADRKYVDRWGMFERHKFDPTTDVKRNRWGVLDFAGNKPDLEREWDAYLRSRNEDVNSID
jgi:hypothetical protein